MAAAPLPINIDLGSKSVFIRGLSFDNLNLTPTVLLLVTRFSQVGKIDFQLISFVCLVGIHLVGAWSFVIAHLIVKIGVILVLLTS